MSPDYCEGFNLELPELTCISDIQAWMAAFMLTMQSGVDHIIACVNNIELPVLDICAIKDDLPSCPLDCDMMNFIGITYAEEGGVCQLPLPPNLGDFEFRTGTGLITPGYSNAWKSTAVVFDTPFTAECLCMNPVVTRVFGEGCPSGVDVEGNDLAIIVQESEITANGCVVYIYRADGNNRDCKVFFRYFAIGH